MNDTTNPRSENRPAQSGRSRRSLLLWIVFMAIVVALVVVGILPRLRARAALQQETAQLSIPTVQTVRPRRGALATEIVLPANIQAYTDSPIFARTNGYLKKWWFDIGAHVKSGQLLAEIETPEVDQQLLQARADLATAQANLRLAEITANRYRDLLKTDAVSRQDADNAAGDYEAKRATVQSAQANVKRLEELQSFQKVYAPFDGVITARNVDVGALIDAGSNSGQGRELFHMSFTRRLRVYVSVPQAYSPAARPGLRADLTLAEFPGRRFPTKLVRTANAIDVASRTLLAEFDAENPAGELLPGAYAELHLKLPASAPVFLVPVNALLFRSEGVRVVVVKQGGVAELLPVALGRDLGVEVEVVSGLNGEEDVIVDPPDSIVDGEKVRMAAPSAPGGG